LTVTLGMPPIAAMIFLVVASGTSMPPDLADLRDRRHCSSAIGDHAESATFGAAPGPESDHSL
jgi:hypothetical protein